MADKKRLITNIDDKLRRLHEELSQLNQSEGGRLKEIAHQLDELTLEWGDYIFAQKGQPALETTGEDR